MPRRRARNKVAAEMRQAFENILMVVAVALGGTAAGWLLIEQMAFAELLLRLLSGG